MSSKGSALLNNMNQYSHSPCGWGAAGPRGKPVARCRVGCQGCCLPLSSWGRRKLASISVSVKENHDIIIFSCIKNAIRYHVCVWPILQYIDIFSGTLPVLVFSSVHCPIIDQTKRLFPSAPIPAYLNRRRESTALIVVHAVRSRHLSVTLGRRRVAQAVAHREQVVVFQWVSML